MQMEMEVIFFVSPSFHFYSVYSAEVLWVPFSMGREKAGRQAIIPTPPPLIFAYERK